MVRSDQRWWVTAVVCACVIAVCYGFARYTYGLFVPEFAEVFGLSATGLGVLGGVSTAGYTAGLLIAPSASRGSSRLTTVAAGGSAAVGLATMSATELLPIFAVGLFVAGFGAGLVSPGVAQLIGRSVEDRVRPQAQTWANTGTSLGLAISAFAPVLAFGWRLTWLGFALLAVVITVAAMALLPRPKQSQPPETSGQTGLLGGLRTPGLSWLLINSLLLGLTSAPYWNFSVERLAELDLEVQLSSWFWLTIGIAGPLGGIAGALVRRYGLRATNLGTWTLWAAAMMLLAIPEPNIAMTITSAAIFGATFMALTGLCILWSARLYPQSPAQGVTLSFLCLGAGQTLGSPLAGVIADQANLGLVFAIAALASVTAYYQLIPLCSPPEEPTPETSSTEVSIRR